MAHAAAAGAEDEVALAAVFAFAAGDGGGAQAGNAIAHRDGFNFAAHFHDGAGELMAQDHGWEVAEGVVEDVEVSAADTAKRNLNLDLLRSGGRFFHIPNAHISIAGSVLHQSFHVSSLLFFRAWSEKQTPNALPVDVPNRNHPI